MTAMMSMSMSMSASASSRPRQVVVHQRGRGGAAGKIHVLGDRTQGSESVSKKKTMADVPQPQPIYPLVGNRESFFHSFGFSLNSSFSL